MSSDESDIELSSALTKKTKNHAKRALKSPTEGILASEEPKKVSTKVMVHKALTALKTRKGVSLYAIKKYIEDEFNVNTEKIKSYIKKYIKAGVEMGTIIQTKGVGASGSFRLAAVKEKAEKKKKTVKIAKEKSSKPEAEEKMAAKKKGAEEKIKKKEMSKKVTAKKTDDKLKKTKPKQKKTKEDAPRPPSDVKAAKVPKTKSTKMAKGAKTHLKKMRTLKRKSIGSIIKPPKMKPTRA